MAAQTAKGGVHRLFGAVCARFMLPEQGMTQFDVLSRASAFSINLEELAKRFNAERSPDQQFPEDFEELIPAVGFHPVVTSLHVVRPFLFPRYYPEEWLQFIRPENIELTLEFRNNDSGKLEQEFKMLPQIVAHPTRDVALMFVDLNALTGVPQDLQHVGKDGDVLDSVQKINILESSTRLHEFSHHDTAGQNLFFGGHLLNTEPHEEDCCPQPAIISGNVVGAVPSQQLVLAETEHILQQGMCGGPVLDKDGLCVGMVEGVVQNVGQGQGEAAGVVDGVEGGLKDGMAAILPASVIEEVVLAALEKRGGERHHPPHDMMFGDVAAGPSVHEVRDEP